MENVVIYARFSSNKQNETSIEAQILECEQYCKRNEYNVIETYADKALSGRSDNRAEFQKMIQDSEERTFTKVVVYQLDRFSRCKEDSAIYKYKLKKNGVKVVSARENITDDPSGILVETMLEGIAEYYSAELSQKVKRNLKLNAEKGWFNGGRVPFGYKSVEVNLGSYTKKKLEINPVTAPVVKKIFDMRAAGDKIKDIVDYLNKEGYKTAEGNEFKEISLQPILRNKRYIGINTYDGKEYPNTIPVIIEKSLFDSVQQMLDGFKHAPAMSKAKNEEYILTTKLFCGKCKSNFVGVCGTSCNGTVYHYYRCNGTKNKNCKRKSIPKDYIENVVISECLKLLTDENIDTIAKKVCEICKKENSKTSLIRGLEVEVKNINKKLENLMIALESGENTAIINKRIYEKNQELNRTKKRLVEEKNKIINLNENSIKFFLYQLKRENIQDIKYKKILINIFVNKIYVYDNKMTIIFNVGDKKVPISDILIGKIATSLKIEKKIYYYNRNVEEYLKPNFYFFVGGFATAVNIEEYKR